MPVRKKRQPSPVGSRVGPYGKPGRTVGMRRPRRPRRSLADAVFPIPAPNIELVGADGRETRPYRMEGSSSGAASDGELAASAVVSRPPMRPYDCLAALRVSGARGGAAGGYLAEATTTSTRSAAGAQAGQVST